MKCIKCGKQVITQYDGCNDVCSECGKLWEADRQPWEPECDVCGYKLVQDDKNLYRIFCPISSQHPTISLSPVR